MISLWLITKIVTVNLHSTKLLPSTWSPLPTRTSAASTALHLGAQPMLSIWLLGHTAHLELCIFPESWQTGKTVQPHLCSRHTHPFTEQEHGTLPSTSQGVTPAAWPLYTSVGTHTGIYTQFRFWSKAVHMVTVCLPILYPMTEPAGALALRGGDRCFILESGMMVQRNKVTQGQILVNSDVESKVNCISWFFLMYQKNTRI